MADELDDIKGREEFADKAERVLFPETDTKEVTFLGKSVSLRPLPIKWAKMLNRAFDKAWKRFGEDAVDTDDGDEEITNAFLVATTALCEFYRLGLTREQIEEQADVPEMIAFCTSAAARCKENDFLLWRLRGASEVIALTALKRQRDLAQMRAAILEADATIPSGSSSPVSQKPTEDSTELSSDTPTDS